MKTLSETQPFDSDLGPALAIPLARPNPPKLSEAFEQLREIEKRAMFSNFGPVNRSFEENLVQQMFGGTGHCVTMCNATIGLMLAIRQAVERRPVSRRRYALMPSFTFAAAAQAAMWNQLTPLFCDIDPLNWAASCEAEEALLKQHGDDIAVVVPYATFGYDIDLNWYETIMNRFGIPVVVDAAASLGTISESGKAFGAGFSGSVVFSMHATKSFATSEGGVVYSANEELIRTLKHMSNFGFSDSRNAEILGLNGKMSEVGALLAELRLQTFESSVQRRSDLVQHYRTCMPELTFQSVRGRRQAHQFATFLVPAEYKQHRGAIRSEMKRRGVESANYFSPHVAEQTFFAPHAEKSDLTVTDDIASRVVTLPLYDTMHVEEVESVISAFRSSMKHVRRYSAGVQRRSPSGMHSHLCS